MWVWDLLASVKSHISPCDDGNIVLSMVLYSPIYLFALTQYLPYHHGYISLLSHYLWSILRPCLIALHFIFLPILLSKMPYCSNVLLCGHLIVLTCCCLDILIV